MLTSVDPDVIRVLGDPLRLKIVTLLARETLCTTHLVEETGAKQTNLSNHLKVLREAGLVETEPCGRFTYYKLRPEVLAGLVETEPCGRFTYYKLRPEVLAGLSEQFAALADSARTASENKRACP